MNCTMSQSHSPARFTIIALLCLTLTLITATELNHKTIHEYQIIYADAERVKNEDLSLLAITPSTIHGRGVTLTRPVAKDTSIGTLYYEVEKEMDSYFTPSLHGFLHARGYITDGGTIDHQRMTVTDAIIRCNEMDKCQGITFQDPQQLFSNPSGPISTADVYIEFKDKSNFGMDPQNSWQSYLKHTENVEATYFPLGCMSIHLPNPPPPSLDPELMLPCWPRYVNHSCRPTAKTVRVPVEEGFMLPGIPWIKVLGAYQVVALRDLGVGDEISLNYEIFPGYMMRRVDGVEECDKMQHDEL